MIDLHCHILPGLDDGALDWDEAVQMAIAAVDDGISTVIATPHHANGRYYNTAETIHAAVLHFNAKLQNQNIPLRVLHGMEIRVYDDLLDDLAKGLCLSLAESNYILLELPFGMIPKQTAEIIHELKVQQLTPIIAHPERNAAIAENTDKLREFIELGALSQVTSGSLNGAFGRRATRLALELCQNNLVHFIASDAHNCHSRPFDLQAAYRLIDRKLGGAHSQLYQQNATRLVNNQDIHRVDTRVQSRWSRFKNKILR